MALVLTLALIWVFVKAYWEHQREQEAQAMIRLLLEKISALEAKDKQIGAKKD